MTLLEKAEAVRTSLGIPVGNVADILRSAATAMGLTPEQCHELALPDLADKLVQAIGCAVPTNTAAPPVSPPLPPSAPSSRLGKRSAPPPKAGPPDKKQRLIFDGWRTQPVQKTLIQGQELGKQRDEACASRDYAPKELDMRRFPTEFNPVQAAVREFACPKCPRKFQHNLAFMNHVKLAHSDAPPSRAEAEDPLRI